FGGVLKNSKWLFDIELTLDLLKVFPCILGRIQINGGGTQDRQARHFIWRASYVYKHPINVRVPKGQRQLALRPLSLWHLATLALGNSGTLDGQIHAWPELESLSQSSPEGTQRGHGLKPATRPVYVFFASAARGSSHCASALAWLTESLCLAPRPS